MTKIVLFPVRFLFTAETDRVGTNALAAEHCLASVYAPAARDQPHPAKRLVASMPG